MNFRLMVVLNSYDAIKEAFLTRGDDFSDRLMTGWEFTGFEDGKNIGRTYVHILHFTFVSSKVLSTHDKNYIYYNHLHCHQTSRFVFFLSLCQDELTFVYI